MSDEDKIVITKIEHYPAPDGSGVGLTKIVTREELEAQFPSKWRRAGLHRLTPDTANGPE